MSRYEWKKEKLTFAIGWDYQMRTYFLLVHDESINAFIRDEDEEAEDCILWLGGNFDEFPQLQPLVEKFLESYPGENIPDVLKLYLGADREGVSDWAKEFALPENIVKIC